MRSDVLPKTWSRRSERIPWGQNTQPAFSTEKLRPIQPIAIVNLGRDYEQGSKIGVPNRRDLNVRAAADAVDLYPLNNQLHAQAARR